MRWNENEKSRRMKAQKELVNQEQERLDSGGFFKAKEGDNIIRVLPREIDPVPYLRVKEVQFDGGGSFFSVISPKTIDVDAYDYILDTVLPNMRSGSDKDQKLAANFRVVERAYFLILDWNNVGLGPQIWSLTVTKKGIFNKLLSIMNDPDYGCIDFPDKDGTDLNLQRTGMGKGTEYTILPRKNTKIVPNEILEDIFDLGEKFKPMALVEQQNLVLEKFKISFDLEGSDEEEEDEIPFDSYPDIEVGEEEPGGPVREPIHIPEDLTPAKSKKYENEAIEESKCFGIMFDGSDTDCLGCAAFLDCAKAVADESPPSTGKGSRRKAGA